MLHFLYRAVFFCGVVFCVAACSNDKSPAAVLMTDMSATDSDLRNLSEAASRFQLDTSKELTKLSDLTAGTKPLIPRIPNVRYGIMSPETIAAGTPVKYTYYTTEAGYAAWGDPVKADAVIALHGVSLEACNQTNRNIGAIQKQSVLVEPITVTEPSGESDIQCFKSADAKKYGSIGYIILKPVYVH